MNGRSLYRLATRHFKVFFDDLLRCAGTNIASLQLVVPHQASGRALDWLQRELAIGNEGMIRILDTRGNQVAASIPSALHEAIVSKRMNRGDTVALVGTGAGLSLGGAVISY